MKSNVLFQLVVGVVFSIGTLALNAQVPGSTCESAVTLECADVSVAGSTAGIASDNATSGYAVCTATAGTGGQIWYEFTAAANQQVTLSTCNITSNYDTY